MPKQYSRLHKGEVTLRLGCNLANGKVGGDSKIGCVLGLDFKHLDGASFMSNGDCYGHLCTNYGSKWQLDGRYFDGEDNYVEVPFSESINPKKAITFEGWSVLNSVADRRISGSRELHYRWIDFEAGTGRYNWCIGRGGDWIYQGVQDWTLPVGEWFHLAYVVDWESGWGKVYLDGVEKSSATFTAGAVAGNTDNLYIGSYSPTGYLWLGKSAEVRIYNRALSALEIQNHYQQERHLFGI